MDKLSIIRSRRLLGQQPHADHDAGRQRAGPPHRRRQRRRRLSVDGFDRRQVPRRQSTRACRPSSAWPTVWKADVWGAGHMGHEFEPVKGNELPGRLAMPQGIDVDAAAGSPGAAPPVRPPEPRLRSRRGRCSRSTATRKWPSTWSSRARCSRPSTSRRSPTRCATPTAARASAKRRCWPGGWSRPASRSCWSAAPGATSIITATKCNGAASKKG